MYPEASKAVVKVEGHQKAVTTLLVACSYEQVRRGATGSGTGSKRGACKSGLRRQLGSRARFEMAPGL